MKPSTHAPSHFLTPKRTSVVLALLLLASATVIVACSDVVGHDDAASDQIVAREGGDTTPLYLREEVKEHLFEAMKTIEADDTLTLREKKEAISKLKSEVEALMLHSDHQANSLTELRFRESEESAFHDGEDSDIHFKVEFEEAHRSIMNDATLSDDEKKEKLAHLKKELHERLEQVEENHFILRESNEETTFEFKFGPESEDGEHKVSKDDVARFGHDVSKEDIHLKETPASSETLKKRKPGQN